MLMMTLLFTVAPAQAETAGDVLSAPLERAETVKNGMVRVWLKSLGTSITTLDVTPNGSYTAEGSQTSFSLASGQSVHVSFNTATGQITMSQNGRSYEMGTEMAFRRGSTASGNGVKIAQAGRPNNLYAGDLKIVARSSGSGYEMYVIAYVYMENYLYGVVPYEMSSSSPLEALKAQAVAARTFTVRKMNSRTSALYDLTDTSSDQVYKGHPGTSTRATQAVDETRGIVAMNDGKLTGTYYTSSNGGQTESSKNAWGSSGYEYLNVHDDPYDKANPGSYTKTLTVYADYANASQSSAFKTLLMDKVRSQAGTSNVSISRITALMPHSPKYASPSRLYTKLDVTLQALVNGSLRTMTVTFDIFTELESALGLSINSKDNELWSVENDGQNFRIVVGRHGHGIGMSQRGAQQMANMGFTYDQILGFYYPGCTRVQYSFTHTVLPPVGEGTTQTPAPIDPPSGTNARVELTSAGATLALRGAASASGKLLTTLPDGAYVTILALGNPWSLVRYGEIVGYAQTGSLTYSVTPPTSSAESPTNLSAWATVTESGALNLRKGPGTEYESLTTLPRNAVLAVFHQSGEWAYVQYGAQTGWCMSKYVTFHSAYPGEEPPAGSDDLDAIAAPDSSILNMRAAPNAEAAIIAEIPKGTLVTVTSFGSEWCAVQWGTVSGWVMTRYLDFDAAQDTPSPVTPTPSVPTPTPAPFVPPTATDALSDTPAETASQDEHYIWVKPDVGMVKLMDQPYTTANVMAYIGGGTRVTYLGTEYGWCQVAIGVHTGYIDADALTEQEPAGALGSRYVSTQSDCLALRETAATTGTLIAWMTRGDTVQLLEEQGEWSRVTWNGKTGYCASRYLSKTPPGAAPLANDAVYDVTLTDVTGWSAIVLSSEETDSPLYAWCSLDAPEVIGVPQRTMVSVVQKGEIWCKVAYEGKEGYCLTSCLTLVPPQ